MSAIRLLLSAGEKWRKLILQEVYLDIHARFYEGYVIHRVVYKGLVDRSGNGDQQTTWHFGYED